MGNIVLIFLLISTSMFSQSFVDKYNVVWKSQSENCYESMPVGGRDIGLNVWVENDELLFYIGQSGTFDENNQMLKHGRVRLKFSPNPFKNAKVFRQELKLHEGGIEIVAKNVLNEIKINLWVDVNSPVIHLETICKEPTEVKTAYETWRMEDRVVPTGMRHSSFSLSGYPGEVVTYKDTVRFTDNGVRWFHRNRSDKLLYNFMVKQQDLEPVKDKIPNTQLNRTFGGELLGEGMRPAGLSNGKYIDTDFTAWQLQSENPQKNHHLRVVLNAGQFDTIQEWGSVLNHYVSLSREITEAKKETQRWWDEFWNRSYIVTNEFSSSEDTVWQLGRNYQLFRYMLGCNAYGEYPSKFNGGFFTVDPVFTRDKYNWTPDFRQWGGGSFTAQNQRLVYWPMLKSGDFDMMHSQFNFYKRALPGAEARTARYWSHKGACFTEQIENFGLPFAGGWGFDEGGRKRSPETEYGVQTNPYVCHHYVNQLEFAMMILEYHRFTGADISSYIPFIKSSLVFFDEHYQYRALKRNGEALDQKGKLVIFPSTVAESYKNALNPVDVIAALKSVIPMVLKLPGEYIDDKERGYFSEYLKRVPELPVGEQNGHKVILPAVKWGREGNNEFPELYAVFPYALYGLNQPDYELALNTWNYGYSLPRKAILKSWSQIPIFAARLGLTEEVVPMIQWKMGNAPNRFPSFWGPGFDWVPDMNHGGSAAVAFQEMLMQTTDEKIYILPAWPKDWDVKFRLHAPQNTVVEVELKGGEFTKMEVTPKSREADVIISLN